MSTPTQIELSEFQFGSSTCNAAFCRLTTPWHTCNAMRQYMPRGHVAFLEQLESRSTLIRDFVSTSSDSHLRAAYDQCVSLVEAFRSTHLDYAAPYIQEQAPRRS